MSKTRAYKKKYHFIYKTTCLVTNKYYYGMHSTDNLDDGYFGSGQILWKSINKHGKENHKIERIEFLESRKELAKRENEIVNEEMLNDPLNMNLTIGGKGWHGWFNEEHKKKNIKAFSLGGQKAFKEKLKSDSEFATEFSNKIKKRWKDPIYREKMQNVSKTAFLGKTHSEETKSKMSDSHTGKHKGELNSQYGTCWITNGKESKKIYKGDSFPDDWRLGRKIKNIKDK